jgi:uncharacterized protein YndB with AHSA1/START domain
MWRHVEVEALVGRPVDLVFGHLADPETWPSFVPAVVMRRRLDDGPVRVGSQWAAVDRVGPFPFPFVDELLAHEPHHRVVWRSSAPWNSTVEYLCTSDVGGTRVHATYEGDPGGWLRILGVVVPTQLARWILSRDFVRLERLLTADPRE